MLRDAAKNVIRVGMRVSCSNCLTEYDVPDAALAGRTRMLRCAHCGHQWQHVAEAVEPVLAAASAPAFAPQPEPEPARWVPVEPSFSSPAPEPVIPISPGFSWAPPPAAPAGWPEFSTEMASRADPPEPTRTFGQPMDAQAQAELETAASLESHAPFSIVSHGLPMQVEEPAPVDEILPGPVDHLAPVTHDLAAPPIHDLAAPPPALPPLSDSDFRTGPAVEADSFAALVSAARRKSLELEPEPPPPPPKIRTSNKKFFILLVILVVIAFAVLEHQGIEKVLPASVAFFNGLGLH
jgi:predicted Zn finger-like uncharacterized protein